MFYSQPSERGFLFYCSWSDSPSFLMMYVAAHVGAPLRPLDVLTSVLHSTRHQQEIQRDGKLIPQTFAFAFLPEFTSNVSKDTLMSLLLHTPNPHLSPNQRRFPNICSWNCQTFSFCTNLPLAGLTKRCIRLHVCGDRKCKIVNFDLFCTILAFNGHSPQLKTPEKCVNMCVAIALLSTAL